MAKKNSDCKTWEVRVSKVLNEVRLLEKHAKLMKVGEFEAAKSISSKDVHCYEGGERGMAVRSKQYLVCQSSLSPKLSQVLKHDMVLPYLIQFLQEKSKAQLVYFWLAAETFRLSDQTSQSHEAQQSGKSDENESHEQDDDDMLDIDVFGPSNPFADSLMTSYDDVMANASKEDLEAAEIEDENGDFGDFCLSGDSRTIRITMMPILEQGSTQIGQNGLEDGESASNDPIDSANFFKQNAVNIFMRYICKDSSQSVDLPDSLGTEIWDKICAQEGVNSYCFVSAQNHVYSILLNEYFESFLSSSHFVNYQLDRITCRNVTLTDVLFCHVTIAYFMEFLQTITLQNLVSCFLSIQNFKLNYDMHCSLSDANSIFNSYFNENSLSTFVQFPEPVISVVEKQILQAKKISMSPESETCEVKIPSSVFDCAFVILGNVLKTEVFPFFLKSRYYRQLKRELEVSFFAMQGASSRDKSDRYAGLSRGTECETLLKADAKGPMVQEPRFVFPIEDESIETIRRKPVKQTLGHVNAIGEYVSQYESLPGGMQGKESVRSKLKQLLTPGRSKKVAEAEEQEAWVTAHKIVNQVNRETLDTGGNIAVNTRINTPESQKHRKYTNISDI